MKMDILQNDLEQLEAQGLYRSLKQVASAQDRTVIFKGQEVLNFSSNDYLGLANDAQLKKTAIQAIEEYGLGSGASRLICGNMIPHEKLEEELALLKHAEAALVYSSGYMANCGIIPSLMDRHGVILSDKFNHASIIDGILLSRAEFLRYPHVDMQVLEEMLKKIPTQKRKLIVTDSVFSMDGDRALLEDIVRLAKQYQAMVMVDEAHGFGVLGKNGGGLVEELGLSHEIDIQMGTLSKAAGCMGAYVAGSSILRNYLINKSRSFIYTTAMPPMMAESARTALKIITQEPQRREKLLKAAEQLRRDLKTIGFDTMNSSTPIIPILVKDSQQAVTMSQRLLEKGILVQAIRPPTVPQGTARLRLTVTAAHTPEDLNQLLDALKGL